MSTAWQKGVTEDFAEATVCEQSGSPQSHPQGDVKTEFTQT